MSKLSRRNFLSALTSGVAGLGFIRRSFADEVPDSLEEIFKIKKYNPLGNTGLKVADVSCGAISLNEPNVLRYAYDCGVNYFDTAETYLNGKSEIFVGQALKDIRDKIIITTKHGFNPREKIQKAQIIERMENSLKRMQTDYVDIALVHGVGDLVFLENQELLEAYAQLKKDGKIRFTGFSTHNAKKTLEQALNNEFTQVVLVIYNHDQGKEIEPLIKNIRQKGIGITAMKVFAGGKQGNLQSLVNQKVSYPQAAIRWVLNNPDIDNLIVTMSSYSHVEEYITASNQPLQRADEKLISDYQKKTRDLYCRVGCDICSTSCPHQVAINDVHRFKMYFEDYKMEKEAIRYYSKMDNSNKPLLCKDCSGICSSSCPYGLKIKDNLIQAHEILSV